MTNLVNQGSPLESASRVELTGYSVAEEAVENYTEC